MSMSDLAAAVSRDIDAAREQLIDLCGRLVAAASVNPPGRTAEVADVVRAFFSSHGIATETVKADDEAPNVVAQIASGASGRHVVFNAHMDTMEASDARPGPCRSCSSRAATNGSTASAWAT